MNHKKTIVFYIWMLVSFICVGTLGYAVLEHEWQLGSILAFFSILSIVGTVFYKCNL